MEIDAAPLRADRRAIEHRSFLMAPPEPADNVSFRGPVAVRAVLRNEGSRIRADIEAHARCEAPCDRCLQPVPFAVDLSYSEDFVTPEQAEHDGIEGGEVDDGEVRTVVYQNDRIELDSGMLQNLALAQPGKHLCREDCLGLCPRCGKNLNEGACGCGPVEPTTDPRLLALADAMRRANAKKRESE